MSTVFKIMILVAVNTLLVGLLLASGEFKRHLKVYVVTSGSMSPAIENGSLLFVKAAENYKVGDVVVFLSPRSELVLAHRIVGFSIDGGLRVYRTRGDANEKTDDWNLGSSRILGKVVACVPKIGLLLSYMRNYAGFVVAIYFIAGVMVYIHLMKIIR
ncbi:signal peptidase I [candidate division WWE3 bacterium]|nr:signal peptidase I [candidate division WWE3 bacterium]